MLSLPAGGDGWMENETRKQFVARRVSFRKDILFFEGYIGRAYTRLYYIRIYNTRSILHRNTYCFLLLESRIYYILLLSSTSRPLFRSSRIFFSFFSLFDRGVFFFIHLYLTCARKRRSIVLQFADDSFQIFYIV